MLKKPFPTHSQILGKCKGFPSTPKQIHCKEERKTKGSRNGAYGVTAAKSEKKSEKDDFLEGEKTSRQQAALAVGSLVNFAERRTSHTTQEARLLQVLHPPHEKERSKHKPRQPPALLQEENKNPRRVLLGSVPKQLCFTPSAPADTPSTCNKI